MPGWKNAEVAFVPAGKTLHDELPDSDPNILHVDTGMGMLDHHQTDEYTCAAKRTLEYIAKIKIHDGKHGFPDEALVRMVDQVNDIDHFKEAYYPNAAADFYDFNLVAIMDGWKLIYPNEHIRLIELGMATLDGIYRTFQNKVWAERENKENGIPFETVWGKGLAVETVNDETVRIAQRSGYTVAVRKDPKKGFVRVKALPESTADLSGVYNTYKTLDPDATWFLHASHKMVLNGSAKNPDSVPSKLTLREIVDVLKNFKAQSSNDKSNPKSKK